MDVHTLLIVITLASCWMVVTMGAMYLISPADRALLDWGSVGLALLVNCAAGFYFERHGADTLVIGLGNASILLAHALVLTGYRAYGGQASPRAALLLFGAALVAAHFLPGPLAHTETRLKLLLSVVAALDLLIVLEVLRTPRFKWASPAGLLALFFMLYAVQLLARVAILSAEKGSALEVVGDAYVQTVGRLAILAFTLVVSTLGALLVVKKKEQTLRQAAELDPLTGWLNRQSLDRSLSHEFQRARRTGSGFQLLVFDIDHFKSINDRYGHLIGDEAIRHLTRCVFEAARGYDLKFRTGGEEFLLFAPAEQVGPLAERVRQAVEQAPLDSERGRIGLTISLGFSGLQPEDRAWTDVLKRADEALYLAKAAGRNCARWQGGLSLAAAD